MNSFKLVSEVAVLPSDVVKYVFVSAPFEHDFVCVDTETGLLWSQADMCTDNGVLNVNIDDVLGDLYV